MEKVDRKGAFGGRKRRVKGIREGRKTHEEECFLPIDLPYIGEYSVS